jgi:acyl-CoA hydrolase
MDEVMSFRKIVKPGDLNPANRLFGGQMMKWLDEAAGIYAACQLKTTKMVTLKVSELLFQSPGLQGDIIEFFCETTKFGTSSFTVRVAARTREFERPGRDIVTAELIFVTIDGDGKPIPHNFGKE